MNTYIAILNGKQIEVTSDTLYDAKLKAIKFFNPKKKELGLLSVMLAQKDGNDVIHDTSSLG